MSVPVTMTVVNVVVSVTPPEVVNTEVIVTVLETDVSCRPGPADDVGSAELSVLVCPAVMGSHGRVGNASVGVGVAREDVGGGGTGMGRLVDVSGGDGWWEDADEERDTTA